MIGGVHISFLPETLSQDMDIGCIGEGEDTIIELMQIFERHRAFPISRLGDVAGIVFRTESGALRRTCQRLAVRNLDSIPYPDRKLLQISSHTYMFTSRGCPYRCRFCASSRFWGNIRYFSSERVVAEIELLVNSFGARFISFFDDLFTANEERFFDIVDLLVRKNIVGKVKFSCSMRANAVTEEIVAGLKRMGVVSVGMGLESGNERILKWLKGSGMTVDQNRRAVNLLRKYGIVPNASFVIGSPDETRKEIMETMKFIKSVDLGLFDVYVLTPYPGTPVWELAKERGLVSEDDAMDWFRLNVNFEINKDAAIIMSNTLTREEIAEVYGKFRRRRLIHNCAMIWRHPMLADLPCYLARTLRERLFSEKKPEGY